MTATVHTSMNWNPGRPFYAGLALVLLATWIPFIPAWSTFIHMWRVDLAASLFLFCTLGYLAVRSGRITIPFSVSSSELNLVIIPLVAFITWSAISISWSPSWKSAAHHTLVWTEYLIFYLVFRYLVDNNEHFGKLSKMFAFVLVLFALPAIIEFLGLTAIGGDTLFRARYAKYGEQIVTILPLLLVIALRSTGRKFQIAAACLVTLWLLVYCTASRVNVFLFAGCIVGIALLVFAIPRFRRYRRPLATSVLLMILSPVPLYLFSLAISDGDVPIVGRFQDATGSAYSSNFRKLMNSVSVEMITSRPITGVGADNYGMQFNGYREQYAATHPSDTNLDYGEIGIVAHAHNEFLQIAAELGIVAVAIFAWLFVGIAWMTLRAVRNLNKQSLFPIAAVIGLGMFLVSSAVSAYSFRLMQNGLLFFFVLAVASRTLLKDEARTEVAELKPAYLRPVFAVGMIACVLLAVYSGFRVSSVIVATKANFTYEIDEATTLYKRSMSLDDENPDVRNNLGIRLFQEDRFAEAVPFFQESIRIGRAETTDFSYLASAQALAGDNVGAEQTMAEAAKLYPRSVFILTRHAALLDINGHPDEALRVFNRARELDYRSANSWWTMIHSGAQAVTDNAFRSTDYTAVKDLQPQSSMYALLDERHVRHPEERLIFRRK